MQAGTVAVISQGCAANSGDGERIANLFAAEGLEISFGIPDAAPRAFVLNVCTVKGNGTALRLLREAAEKFPGTPALVTGCVPPDLLGELHKNFSSFSIANLYALRTEPALMKRFLSGERIEVPGNAVARAAETGKEPAEIRCRENRYIGTVNIEEGCLDACAYCSTHLVKGKLASAAEEAIVREVAFLVSDGCREIRLAGQDTSCYGFDTGTNLAELLQKILSRVPGDYRIRIGMGNPRHIFRYLDALLETYQDDRLYKFIHLPVQSGSDRVLALMRRRHTAEDYRRLAGAFQERIPGITLSTDIIAGFPGETREDHEASLALIRDTRPTLCNITRFVPRPGTLACELGGSVPKEERFARSAELAEVFQEIALENNGKFTGRECRILLEKQGKRAGTFIGRDDYYHSVALKGTFEAGAYKLVRITGAETFALRAEVL